MYQNKIIAIKTIINHYGTNPPNISNTALSSLHRNSTCRKHFEQHTSFSFNNWILLLPSSSLARIDTTWDESSLDILPPGMLWLTSPQSSPSLPTAHIQLEQMCRPHRFPAVTTRHICGGCIGNTWLIHFGHDDRLHSSHLYQTASFLPLLLFLLLWLLYISMCSLQSDTKHQPHLTNETKS